MAKSQAALDADPAGQRPLELLCKESDLVSDAQLFPYLVRDGLPTVLAKTEDKLPIGNSKSALAFLVN
jgi:hypothetical protein